MCFKHKVLDQLTVLTQYQLSSKAVNYILLQLFRHKGFFRESKEGENQRTHY